jgi:hypothetical protein
MNDYMFDDFDFDRAEELDELRVRVERKREIAATKKLAKRSNFDLYLEESGPINIENELGFSINNRNWDE